MAEHRIVYDDLKFIIWREKTTYAASPLIGACMPYRFPVEIGLRAVLERSTETARGKGTRYHRILIDGQELTIRRIRPLQAPAYYEIEALGFEQADTKWKTPVAWDLRKNIETKLAHYRSIESNRQLLSRWQQKK